MGVAHSPVLVWKTKSQNFSFPHFRKTKSQNFRISEFQNFTGRRSGGARNIQSTREREKVKTLRAPIARPPDVGMAYRHVRGIMCPEMIRMGVAHSPVLVENEMSKFQNFRISEFQNFRISEFQNFRISRVSAQRRGSKHPEHSRAREGKVSRARPSRGLRMSGWRTRSRHHVPRNDPDGSRPLTRLGVENEVVKVSDSFQSFNSNCTLHFHGCRRSGGARNIQSTREREKVSIVTRAHRAASGCRDGASARSRHHVPRDDPMGVAHSLVFRAKSQMTKNFCDLIYLLFITKI